MSEKAIFKTITLKKPIGESKDITQLKMRELTFKDLRKHNLPVDAKGNIDFDKAAPLLADLVGVMPIWLDQMSPVDCMNCISAISEQVAGEAEETVKK